VGVASEGVLFSVNWLPESGLGSDGFNHLFVDGVGGSSESHDGSDDDELEHLL